MTAARDVLTISPVIPVVVLDRPEAAVPLARALVRGGILVIEITLRTPAALAGIAAVAAAVPDITVGAGTVVDGVQARSAVDAGAGFLVTPGSPPRLMEAVADVGVPVLPGAGTLTEMMSLTERGYPDVKFFPAQASGGVPWLQAIHAALPQVRVCPTGGITADLAAGYLALPHVPCVGGSWIAPPRTLAAGDWDAVESRARAAAALR